MAVQNAEEGIMSVLRASVRSSILCQIANFFAFRDGEIDLGDDLLYEYLIEAGFGSECIDDCILWLEEAGHCGHLADILGMYLPQGQSHRIANPKERVYFSESLWNQLQALRRKGLLNADVSERLVEGIRSMDVREWDESEIADIVAELLAFSIPEASEKRLRNLLLGFADPQFYS